IAFSAPYLSEMVRQEMYNRYGESAYEDGYRIYTTITRKVQQASITTVAMLEMTQAGREMTDEELKTNPAVEQEWDIQWEIFRLL
ncbi:DUF416 family protein, partial [Salmonella enterica subsp. enterica serovar Montevideo]|nr:DUF416 family protein [Salmonella enterica subsp. enterica serovar Montevideo]